MAYFVYILECADGTYYAGITNDLEKRIARHNASPLGAKYTRSRRPVKLIYSEEFETKSAALKREAEIKSLDRDSKNKLLDSTERPNTNPADNVIARSLTTKQSKISVENPANSLFEYTLRTHARAKHLRITVYPDQRVVVTVPSRIKISEKKLNEFLADKSDWVKKQLSVYQKAQPAGRNYDEKKSYAAYKDAALRLVERRILELNAHYGFYYKSIRITNTKTQWGSCSRDGVLSFNYRIAFLEQKHADYLIVHELCHLQEFNHSPRFWKLVEQTIPDYIQARKDMRKEGLSLY